MGKRYPACIFMCESAGWPGRLRTKKSDAKITSILRGQGKIQDNASMPRNRSVASVPDRRERMVGGGYFPYEKRVRRIGPGCLRRVEYEARYPDLSASRGHFLHFFRSKVEVLRVDLSWEAFSTFPNYRRRILLVSNTTMLPKIDSLPISPSFSCLLSIPLWN